MKKNRKYVWLWTTFAIICTFVIGAIVAGEIIMTSSLSATNKFYEGTFINDTDVSGMTVDEASNLIGTKMVDARDDIELSLAYNGKTWDYKGKDFEVNNKILPIIENAYSVGRVGSFWDRRNAVKDLKTNGMNVNISYKYVLGGIDEKIEDIILEIEKEPKNAEIIFNAEKNDYEITSEVNGAKVDREGLYNLIENSLSGQKKMTVDIPVEEILPTVTKAELSNHFALRGSFSTSYKNSQSGRRNNVQRALKDFNGLKVEPNQQISFNAITGDKTEEKGYQPAKIILNGVYIDGMGGGVCQASTTLYNALLLSDLQIDEVNKHSLPVSYVYLSFDAMVSEGYSDMVFTNNSEYPIYIKAWGDSENCYAEIYGEPLEEGITIKRRTDFIRAIPHTGDTIIQDTNKEYADKITFKGEYLRLKMPQEGYESDGYLDYYKDGELLESKLIRHEIYQPQNGVIIEGTEELIEGMTIPENTVKFVPSQIQSNTSESSVEQKIANDRPAQFSP